MSKINCQVIFLYLLALVFLYPIFAHILMYQLGYMINKLPHGKFWIYMQIFLSSPALIILGLLLYFKYGGITNKILGTLFLLISAYWLYNIISDLINETA